ncbi:DUF2283 domain-containing protein [Herbidospora daliensis]|uniref:DUF2283 domain-containing protein n=1 Tax=Herbidospora daliensis TaxID=295585 RepID=UPI0009FE3019|nr:DUF2283 domain-containing protein [Herbidospora daliensis]
MAELRVTYDRLADAAYIYISDRILPGEVVQAYTCDPSAVAGMIILDFDKSGKLIGIEVLGATSKLPRRILDSAEHI